MMYRNFYPWQLFPSLGFLGFLFIPLIILDLVLKGIALWRVARNGQNIWFIALLLINSAGILPAIYLLFFQGKSKK